MQFFKSIERFIRRTRNRLSTVIYHGDAVHCPVCERSFSKFLPAGTGKRRRDNAVCPRCRARERDRLTWLFMTRTEGLFRDADMQFLHVAPEPCFIPFLSARIGGGYLTGDLMRDDVAVKLDVMELPFEDASLDAIYCSHVLQDVPDDTKALDEFFRALKPGGWAILNIPLFAEKTVSNDQPENIRATWDKRPDEHVRQYGPDYVDQLRSHGFEAAEHLPESIEPDAGKRRLMGIDGSRVGTVFFVRKPQ